MADYHTVYEGKQQTTEFDDLLVKHGIKEAPPPKWKPEKYTPEEEEPAKDKDWLDERDEQELSDLEDDFDDDSVLAEYRRKRLEEMRQATQAPKFNSVDQIAASDFVREITNAGEEVWVVLHLFKDGVPDCRVMTSCLDELAKKYTATKFRKIISTECIPKYPDTNLPTILIYKDKQCVQTLVGITPYGGKKTTPEQVAFTLNRFGPICRLEGEEHSNQPTVEEVKKYMEKFVMDAMADREEKADEDEEA